MGLILFDCLKTLVRVCYRDGREVTQHRAQHKDLFSVRSSPRTVVAFWDTNKYSECTVSQE